jgi:hypothetical protein
MGWRRWLHYIYLRLIRLQSTPHALARGLAVGVFAGAFPIFGFQTLVALLLAVPFQGNKIVAAAGTWWSNPLTYVPIFAFNYQVGQGVLGSAGQSGGEFAAASWQSWMDWGMEVVSRLFLGSAIVGLIVAIFSYFLGLWLAVRLQRRRRARLAQNSQR